MSRDQVSDSARIPELMALVREAAERVMSGVHDVDLPTERLIESKRERRNC